MSLAVELPNGEELNEWLAVNTIEFYNEISMLYGTLMEVTTFSNLAFIYYNTKINFISQLEKNIIFCCNPISDKSCLIVIVSNIIIKRIGKCFKYI